MENYFDIKENFNGQITLENECYFFDLNNDVLRIFFNANEINTVAKFNKKYLKILKNGWLYGHCEDDMRVAFFLSSFCYSNNPSKYSEYKILACIKEKFYLLDNSKEKLQDFTKFCEIRISGNLVNNCCLRPYYKLNKNLEIEADNDLILSHENCYIKDKKIELNKSTKCLFGVTSIQDKNVTNQITHNSYITFKFFKDKQIEKITPMFYSIKKFIDICCFARNTKFEVELLQKYKDKKIAFATMKVYENYRNYCNRPTNEYVQIPSIAKNIDKIFDNLNSAKYSLLFLPIDNDDYYSINYTDVQNLTTAIEIACDIDNEFDKIKKKYSQQEYGKVKAKIIYDWCKPYKKLLKERYFQNKGFDKPLWYNLTIKQIMSFRDLRNDITHRAIGKINQDICNCYLSLRYILCNYILCVYGKDENNQRLVNI